MSRTNARVSFGPKVIAHVHLTGEVNAVIVSGGFYGELEVLGVGFSPRASIDTTTQAKTISAKFERGVDLNFQALGGEFGLTGCFYLLPVFGVDACGDIPIVKWLERSTVSICSDGAACQGKCNTSDACGFPCACGSQFTCAPNNTCVPACADPANERFCDGACINVANDAHNCGKCGKECVPPKSFCRNKSCVQCMKSWEHPCPDGTCQRICPE